MAAAAAPAGRRAARLPRGFSPLRRRARRQPHLNRRVRWERHLTPFAEHVGVDGAGGAVHAHRNADWTRDLADRGADEPHPDESADGAAATAGAGVLDRAVAVRVL